MRKKLSVTGKTVATQKQRSFVDRCRRYRIDAACRTQLNGRFDVAGCRFARSTRLDSRLNKATDVIEMIDHRLGERIGKRLSGANDVVTGLQIECACRVSEQLSIANDHRHANS